jgi:hypothetical protein
VKIPLSKLNFDEDILKNNNFFQTQYILLIIYIFKELRPSKRERVTCVFLLGKAAN